MTSKINKKIYFYNNNSQIVILLKVNLIMNNRYKTTWKIINKKINYSFNNRIKNKFLIKIMSKTSSN